MTDLEKIQYTKNFIDKLANGINPLDDSPIPDGDLFNNIRISRCMFYVSSILGKVIEEGSNYLNKNKSNVVVDFTIGEKDLEKYHYSESPIPISTITKKINEEILWDTPNKIDYKTIQNWLIINNYLQIVVDITGHNKTVETKNGLLIGIFSEIRENNGRTYKVILYNKDAQAFIIKSLNEIIKNRHSSKMAVKEIKGNFSKEHPVEETKPKNTIEDSIIELYHRGIDLHEISRISDLPIDEVLMILTKNNII